MSHLDQDTLSHVVCKRCATNCCAHGRVFCGGCRRKLSGFAKSHNRRARDHGVYGSIGRQDWINILVKYNFSCAHCLSTEVVTKRGGLQLDHIIPLSKGGLNLAENIQPLCEPCHNLKDFSVPESTKCNLFRNESKVYDILLRQFDRWICRSKWLREKKLATLRSFRDSHSERLSKKQHNQIEQLLNRFES